MGILACVAIPSSAVAQIPALQPGLRVRIEAPGSSRPRLVGILMAQTLDTLSVAVGPGQIRLVPTHAIRTVQVSAGNSRIASAVTGAVVGGVGLIASALLFGEGWDAGDAIELVGGFGLTGGLIGWALGWLAGGEHWKLSMPLMAGGAVVGALIGRETWRRLHPPLR